jgi:hypothetical protein
MPDQNLPIPEPHPYRPLAPSARRAIAGMMLHTALGRADLLGASVLIDSIDGATWGILAAAGCSPMQARAILHTLWLAP